MVDLYNNKYDRDFLKNNIYNIKLIDLLKTQIIDANFAVKYVLNPKYQLTKEEETTITLQLVLKYQPHLSYKELQQLMREYESDNDSIYDFETVSNN